MKSKVFISCGQANKEERDVADKVKSLIESKGFEAYVATQTQRLKDVNDAIISELKSSDYYIFIDFKREMLVDTTKVAKKAASSPSQDEYRGSLFTHQELALAYVLDFPQSILLKEEGVKLEGIGAFLLSNAKLFTDKKEVVPIIEKELTDRKWDPQYTRHLKATRCEPSPNIFGYQDHAGKRLIRAWYIHIENRRMDLAARDTSVHLKEIQHPDGNKFPAGDNSEIKWAGHLTRYQMVIPPKGTRTIDAFVIDATEGSVYLNSSLDVTPRKPIIGSDSPKGKYTLFYEVFADQFTVQSIVIEIDYTGYATTTSARIL